MPSNVPTGALGVAPDFAEARVNLALGYLKAGNLARASAHVNRAREPGI